MRRADAAFVAVVALSLVAGGTAVASFGTTVATADLVPVLQDRMSVEVDDVAVTDGEMVVTATIHNPSAYPVRVSGGFFQVTRAGERIAYGSASLPDAVTVPAHGSATVTFRMPLTDTQARRVERALGSANGTVLHHRYAMQVRGTQFTLHPEPVHPEGEP